MRPSQIDNMFHNLTFTKSATEIIGAALQKIDRLNVKIEERIKRVAALRAEYGIDDAALVQLLTAARKQDGAVMQYTYSTSNAEIGASRMEEQRTVGAGVVNNLLTESDFIEAERDQVRRLQVIARNLKPIARYADGDGSAVPPAEFTLSYDELEYLDF